MQATLYTFVALMAFAANALLCRMALTKSYIDPWNFTIIRLLGGAICLAIILSVHRCQLERRSRLYHHASDAVRRDAVLHDTGSWLSSISLVVYALCFSLAYVALDTATGALILFSAVQFTMIGWGIYQKEPLGTVQWAALFMAFVGFFYLMMPSATTPSLFGAVMMAISGMAWGIYSIRGKACVSPLRATGFNFARSLIAIPLLSWIGRHELTDVQAEGLILASVSGAIASGIGYSLWYVAMPLLKNTQAAVVQLCVPVLAAIAGILFLSEPLTLRFMLASVVILSAVLIFVLYHKARTCEPDTP